MDAERDALVALYRATNGESWIRKTGWCTSAPLSEWYGIKVSEGRVVELYLRENNLRGWIHKELGQLGALTKLDLSRNQLDGSIPEELGQLGALTKLDLSRNQLEWWIPEELGQLLALTNLDISHNKLEGWIPEELGQLLALTNLDISHNKLEGCIPEELGQLGALTMLDLSNNKLEGLIPKELGQLGALTKLDLSRNQLEWSIPKELGQLGALTMLDLSNNKLKRSIPKELGQMGALTNLDISHNKLEGSIPKELGQLGALTMLDLSNNKLEGSIPKELGQLGALTKLFLLSNQLEGSIPKELGQLGALMMLDLSDNKLEGSIPKELGQLLALTNLDISHNKLEESGDDLIRFYIGSQQKSKVSTGKPRMENEMSEVDIPDEAKGKPKMKNQMSEVDVPDEEAQEQITAEKAASNPEHDKGSSDFGNEKEVILAEGLGTQAMEFLDSSFGIELILEANSLETEIKEQVVVKPGMKFVTCEDKRDTSRTHDELLEWSSKDDDGEKSDTSTLNFLLMPIVYGPSDVTFHPDRPAKLRYFVGNLEDLQDEIRGDGGGDDSHDAVVKHLGEVYEPLISADGEKWRMLPPFHVEFKKRRNGATDVWLETRLYHFSQGSIGKLIKRSKLEPDSGVYEGKMPLRLRWWKGHGRHVIFGNDTREELIFYARKKECVTAAEMGGGGGVNAGPANVTGERNEAVSVQSLRKDDIMKYVVRAGKYVTVAMHIEGNWVHKQILYAVFFSEPPSVEQRKQFFLQQDHINKGTMVIVRPQLLKWWKSEEGSGTTKKLARDATLKSVDEFLSQDI